MKTNNVIITIVLVLIAGTGGFFAGVKYQQSKNPRPVNFQRNMPSGRQGTRPVGGEIIGVNENSVTVKLADNSSKIIFLTEATTFNKSAEGAKSDLKMGERVVAVGTENADGSVTARNIQINPTFRNIEASGSGKNQ